MDALFLLSDSLGSFVLLKIVELILLVAVEEGRRLRLFLRVVELEGLLIFMRAMGTVLADDWLLMVLLDVWLIVSKSRLGLAVLVISEEILHFSIII